MVTCAIFACITFELPAILAERCKNCTCNHGFIQKFVPCKKPRLENSKTPPWMTNSAVKLLKKNCRIFAKYNKKPTNWWGRQMAAPLKVHPKPSEAAFFSFSRTSINAYRRFAVAACPHDGPHLKDSQWYSPRKKWYFRWVQHLIACCSQPEANSDVISGRYVEPVIPHNRAKFGDSPIGRVGETPRH